MVSKEKKSRYKIIGTRPIRHDGYDKVTGRAQYGADIKLPGMIYGAVLRSPPVPAISNAVNDAIGTRILSTPIKASKILNTLKNI